METWPGRDNWCVADEKLSRFGSGRLPVLLPFEGLVGNALLSACSTLYHFAESQIFALKLREKYTEKIQAFPDMWYILQVYAIKIRPKGSMRVYAIKIRPKGVFGRFKKNDFPIR